MEVFTSILCCLCLIVSIVIVIVLRQIIKDINDINDRVNIVRARIVDSFNEVKDDMRIESQTIQVLMETHFLALNGDEYESYEPNEENNEENKDN